LGIGQSGGQKSTKGSMEKKWAWYDKWGGEGIVGNSGRGARKKTLLHSPVKENGILTHWGTEPPGGDGDGGKCFPSGEENEWFTQGACHLNEKKKRNRSGAGGGGGFFCEKKNGKNWDGAMGGGSKKKWNVTREPVK